MPRRRIRSLLLLTGIGAAVTAAVRWNSARTALPPEPAGPLPVERRQMSWTDSGRVLRPTVYVPAGSGPFPTLLFAPGMTVAVESYSTFITDLASRGFIVVAMPHPRFENVDDTPLIDAQPVFARSITALAGGVIAAHVAGDSIMSRVDTARIAAIGHSIGGAGSAYACTLDRRIRAAVDLDGSLYGHVVHEGAACPFLLIEKAPARVLFTDPPVFHEDRAQGQIHQDSVFTHTPVMTWVTVEGLEHMSYTDGSLRFRTRRWLADLAGLRMPAARAQRISADIATDFLRRHLGIDTGRTRGFPMPRGTRVLKSKP